MSFADVFVGVETSTNWSNKAEFFSFEKLDLFQKRALKYHPDKVQKDIVDMLYGYLRVKSDAARLDVKLATQNNCADSVFCLQLTLHS